MGQYPELRVPEILIVCNPGRKPGAAHSASAARTGIGDKRSAHPVNADVQATSEKCQERTFAL
jgi:hypothetical protein